MAVIRMKGVKIKNLDQLREHFDFTNAKDYLLQGTLSAWIREQGETDLAEELEELKEQNYSDQTLADNFSGIFGLKQAIPIAETTVEIVGTTAEIAGTDVSPVKSVYTSFKKLAEVTLNDAYTSISAQKTNYSFGGGDFTPACSFGETGAVFVDEEFSLYGVNDSNSPKDVRRLIKNRMALLIVQRVANSLLPAGTATTHGCQWQLDLETDFADFGFTEGTFWELGKYISGNFQFQRYGIGFLADASINFSTVSANLLCWKGTKKENQCRIRTLNDLLAFVGKEDILLLYDQEYNGVLSAQLLQGKYKEVELKYGR